MKDKADTLRGREKDELTQAYKSYSYHAFPNDETRHPRCKNALDYVLCSPTNDECQMPNLECVMRKCTACNYIDLPGVERYSSNLSPMIVFNMYMTQFTCSHHGILIRERITTYFDEKGTYRILFSLVKNQSESRLLISNAEDCMRE